MYDKITMYFQGLNGAEAVYQADTTKVKINARINLATSGHRGEIPPKTTWGMLKGSVTFYTITNKETEELVESYYGK